jgi:hypothetical protein
MPILWHKIANGATEAQGNGAGFYGKPYQPGGIIKNDLEYILFLRKGGEYRSAPMIQKALSMLTREEMQNWQRSIWTNLPGVSTRGGHPAPYPIELAERLIKLFSFAGDTVLDPFGGTGSTSQAAIIAGRNSIVNEIEPAYWRGGGLWTPLGNRVRQARPRLRSRLTPTLQPSDYRLLTEFRRLFEGKIYKHRASNQGDFVAMHLYEDLVTVQRSPKLIEATVLRKDRVVNAQNRRRGVDARRGDGTFGEIIPGENGYFQRQLYGWKGPDCDRGDWRRG